MKEVKNEFKKPEVVAVEASSWLFVFLKIQELGFFLVILFVKKL
jgi:hypothetical protein